MTAESAKEAGRILGAIAIRNGGAVDANIAAAALARPRPLLLRTSDPIDMWLTSGKAQIGIEHV
ncbi:hypothetical protein SAMN05661080_04373 [Modestobacter sp. DSM 44400]|uniref:hypothetical protein n=1 Tax=Modestobacter sp. DSM 44400 TaxID=1550230 RepID=UPI00089BACC4|nr:hypothetical protein [Modestobacter sp. DSM 44400]SDY71314.1 hypothetical protein SAMN05661080_04373 [Modestobacter sp. DSM 44400]